MNKMNLQMLNVSKVFRTTYENLEIFNNVSLEINCGTTVIITGESGTGKSTLLNLIGGLDRPSSGEIICGKYRVSHSSEAELTSYRRDTIGFIFQFHYLLKDFTAIENVMLPAYMSGIPRKEAMKTAKELLSYVNLSDRLTHYPSQLSGGERQRVAVARSIINNPDFVLADEPTGNLDEKNSRGIEKLLFSMVTHFGKTLILATHDASLSEKGDRHFHLINKGLKEI